MTVAYDKDAKDRLKGIINQRDLLESELHVIVNRLTLPGGAGLEGNLVDAEGYPRADIDVVQARQDRHRVAVLKNDLRALMTRIEQGLHALHSQAPRRTPQAPTQSGEGTSSSVAAGMVSADRKISETPYSSNDSQSCFAFALVDEVSTGSPAEEAGVTVGDQVIDFGGVRHSKGGELARASAELSAKEGEPIPVTLQRQGENIHLFITPKRWTGRGLLGCHMRPLS
mmetsp:Transcript_24381/g.33588  ORF Transcript_24381/g.33588 Transcript_24381/m.33588 type:complete len:227 (+) Transcript_24381:82-762(+)|eukprot:CAMPEP_0196590364 /NCGR_PEP_ID=MMETSP1081-20130531/66412_1 /TAXON_ID=36882 /ORGANISM="Pyramimonas amylifera, Strain CCMP720" /LENGTH=226 /DNA_ID=CAMNT_0041913443 /DNA_START=82 /DNA_END=762 /DNA_ORIENTATION=-